MGTVNNVQILGNLGGDPELRNAGSSVVCSLRVATTRFVKGGQNETDWHNVVLWNSDAEVAERYLRKGMPVHVSGRIQYRQWTDQKTGEERYRTEIVCQRLTLIHAKDDDAGAGRGPARSPARVTTVAKSDGPQAVEGSGATGAGDGWRDDDIPF